MPAVSNKFEMFNRQVEQLWRRGKGRRTVAEQVLPEDFTGQIYLKARELHALNVSRRAELQEELQEVETAIATARLARPLGVIRDAAQVGRQPGIFDSPDDWSAIAPVDRGARFTTDETLAHKRKTLAPLQRRQAWLNAEISRLNAEVSNLEKIGKMATNGDKALLVYLAQGWAQKLEVGSEFVAQAAAAKLSPHYAFTASDMFGNPWPEEALDDDGNFDDDGGKLRGRVNYQEEVFYHVPE
jgi:hypothetical protein